MGAADHTIRGFCTFGNQPGENGPNAVTQGQRLRRRVSTASVLRYQRGSRARWGRADRRDEWESGPRPAPIGPRCALRARRGTPTLGCMITEALVRFIGTATVLISCGPFTVLTDPNFLHRGQYAWLGRGLVSRRLTEPAVQISELPPLDAIVLSHLHGDHWDRVARRGLDRGLPILTTPHAARRLQGLHGYRRASGLQTWDTHVLTKDASRMTLTALPAVHAHGMVRSLLPPVMGSLLEFAGPAGRTDLRLYLTGDTLLFDGIREIARRCGPLDAAVVHLGGTTLPGSAVVTLDGAGGADLVEIVRPHRVVPVHHADYSVFKSPLAEFTTEMERRGLGDTVTYLAPGQTAQITPRP